MPDMILDGSGNNFRAKVNSSQQLETKAVSISEAVEANRNGDAYNVNTGYITLTNGTDTPVMYLKNNETKNLVVEAIAIGIEVSTGGASTESNRITVIRNPKTGTIISGATAVDVNSNRNYTNASSLTVDAFKGATGNTMTDGDNHLLINPGTGPRGLFTINEILPTGATIGIKFKPQASNTSVNVYAAIICYLQTEA